MTCHSISNISLKTKPPLCSPPFHHFSLFLHSAISSAFKNNIHTDSFTFAYVAVKMSRHLCWQKYCVRKGGCTYFTCYKMLQNQRDAKVIKKNLMMNDNIKQSDLFVLLRIQHIMAILNYFTFC